ncbi:hypothetical protein GGQ99_001284 [Aminobacter niigataensis]|uniref:Hedgehog/Intein (Hint) domain-containing protein n=1 Tax=Aminobacter niigataensis TaxID=83265 RepID=A0ABR6KYG2_9HYPH|nr:hypothetical protein [Aminobacter niigataensis]MBB4649562.1 hypothetical protein [Aminobacter niigataensis]
MIGFPAVPYVKGLPQIARSTSVSRAGQRAVAFVEYADPFWRIEVETGPLVAEHAPAFRAFLEEAGTGMETVLFAPKYLKVPQAYVGDEANPALSNTGSLVSVTDGFIIAVGSVTNGLDLRRGDLISLKSGDYRSLHRVMVGAVASAGAISLTVEPAIPEYIVPGAEVKFRDLELNTRMLSGSGSMPDDYLPAASFTLVEVPK